MSRTIFRSGTETRLDDRGVALPLALLGLVLISLLVTSTLVTSSTEVAIGGAHQDAVRSLYAAESVIEQLLAAGAGSGVTPGTHRAGGHDVTVSLLSRRDHPLTPETAPFSVREGVYAFTARPGGGEPAGRSITALHGLNARFIELTTDFDAAVTAGRISGETASRLVISRSASDSACGVVEHAVVVGEDHGEGDDAVPAEAESDGFHILGMTADQLLARALGRADLDVAALARFADIRFGRVGDDWHRAFSGSPQAEGSRDDPLNWGCPVGLVGGCGANPHREHAPVVAIDASAAGTAPLNSHHGQGMLLVVNSREGAPFEIGGGFVYRGLVVVDGSLRISGSPRIHGALLVTGKVEVEAGESGGGYAEIRHDACAIAWAESALADSSAKAGPVTVRRAGWFEVVR